MIQVDKTGVHITHCCLIHGCKYGAMSKDPCPVASGQLAQKYRCEYCEDQYEEWGSPDCSVEPCKNSGYWRWKGTVAGSGLLMVHTVKVFFYMCDEHDAWHRFSPEWKIGGSPMDRRVQ